MYKKKNFSIFFCLMWRPNNGSGTFPALEFAVPSAGGRNAAAARRGRIEREIRFDSINDNNNDNNNNNNNNNNNQKKLKKLGK
jgi:hypothetical protein